MEIKKIFIQRDREYREINFTNNINLIYSKENSKGKTTLLRAILFGLGYNIPATDGIKTFADFFIRLELITDNLKEYTLERRKDLIFLKENDTKISYQLPEQVYELHSRIFDIKDITILNNLLAVFYIDQEKGWTLLNRGTIIGKNRFNIEEFISALSEKDVVSINNEIKKTESEIQKYKSLRGIAEYKEQNAIEYDVNYEINDDDELYNNLNLLKMREAKVKKDLKEISGVLNNNKKLIDYLEKLDIYVVGNDGKPIQLSKANILNYNDNNIYYETRRRELEVELNKIKFEEKEIDEEINSRNLFFNSKTIADEIDEMLKNVNINKKQIEKIIGQLERKKQKLTNNLRAILAENDVYLNSIYNNVTKYSKELGIDEYIKNTPNFVLTNKLKGKTGRILVHMSFSFKMAYICEIKNKYGIKLPIIIDSPRTNELTHKSSLAMIKILERDFKEHQIIFASVDKFNEISKNIIEMNNNLFD